MIQSNFTLTTSLFEGTEIDGARGRRDVVLMPLARRAYTAFRSLELIGAIDASDMRVYSQRSLQHSTRWLKDVNHLHMYDDTIYSGQSLSRVMAQIPGSVAATVTALGSMRSSLDINGLSNEQSERCTVLNPNLSEAAIRDLARSVTTELIAGGAPYFVDFPVSVEYEVPFSFSAVDFVNVPGWTVADLTNTYHRQCGSQVFTLLPAAEKLREMRDAFGSATIVDAIESVRVRVFLRYSHLLNRTMASFMPKVVLNSVSQDSLHEFVGQTIYRDAVWTSDPKADFRLSQLVLSALLMGSIEPDGLGGDAPDMDTTELARHISPDLSAHALSFLSRCVRDETARNECLQAAPRLITKRGVDRFDHDGSRTRLPTFESAPNVSHTARVARSVCRLLPPEPYKDEEMDRPSLSIWDLMKEAKTASTTDEVGGRFRQTLLAIDVLNDVGALAPVTRSTEDGVRRLYSFGENCAITRSAAGWTSQQEPRAVSDLLEAILEHSGLHDRNLSSVLPSDSEIPSKPSPVQIEEAAISSAAAIRAVLKEYENTWVAGPEQISQELGAVELRTSARFYEALAQADVDTSVSEIAESLGLWIHSLESNESHADRPPALGLRSLSLRRRLG